MKTFLLPIAIASFVFVGCTTEDDNCKFCFTQLTDTETGKTTPVEDGEGEYCDAALEQLENQEPAELDGIKTEWICE